MSKQKSGLKRRVEQFHANPPENLEQYTDIYFKWSKEASEEAGVNPRVTKYIHAGLEEDEKVAGLEETAELYDRMTSEEVEILVPEDRRNGVDGREPLMMVEGPLQELFTPETVALGSLSYYLTEVNEGYEHPEPEEYGEGVGRITGILEELNSELEDEADIGFADFGARHYHPEQQKELAQAAFENGAIGHSTPKGAEAINEMLDGDEVEPSGTMNHAYVLGHAAEHGLEDATLEAFKNYDEIFDDRPTPVLIDTNNAEIDDTLEVCKWMEEEYGEDFDLTVRIDTNSANYAQGVDPVSGNKGVSVEAAKAWNKAVIDNSYRDNITFLISSGKGYVDEMSEWADECKEFYEETGHKLFDGVGAGSFDTTDNLYTTSDIVMAEGEPLGKKGRLEELKDSVGGDFKTYIEENMFEYSPARTVEAV